MGEKADNDDNEQERVSSDPAKHPAEILNPLNPNPEPNPKTLNGNLRR